MSTNSRARSILATWLCVVSLGALVGCSSEADESPEDQLLTKADLEPLKTTRVDDMGKMPDGSPYWSCGGVEGAYLTDEGWKLTGRDLSSGTDDWSVVSIVLTNPDASAADQLPKLKAANDACLADGQKLPEIDLGKDRFGYKSLAEGRTDALRGYAVAGDHELVQVTILGLDDTDAPPEMERLLDAAVKRAG